MTNDSGARVSSLNHLEIDWSLGFGHRNFRSLIGHQILTIEISSNYLSDFESVSIRVHPCPSVSIRVRPCPSVVNNFKSFWLGFRH
jgi:hypothetical protein